MVPQKHFIMIATCWLKINNNQQLYLTIILKSCLFVCLFGNFLQTIVPKELQISWVWRRSLWVVIRKFGEDQGEKACLWGYFPPKTSCLEFKLYICLGKFPPLITNHNCVIHRSAKLCPNIFLSSFSFSFFLPPVGPSIWDEIANNRSKIILRGTSYWGTRLYAWEPATKLHVAEKKQTKKESLKL